VQRIQKKQAGQKNGYEFCTERVPSALKCNGKEKKQQHNDEVCSFAHPDSGIMPLW
jgi:hypothetical protein